MFSGGDSSDGINSLNQFGAYGFVNQVAVSNAMAAGQNIDWAQLAQQWIQMRDNSEIEAKMDSVVSSNKVAGTINNYKFEEKGEADMDMDDEEQSDDKATQRSNNDFAPPSAAHNINQTWFFGEGNSQIAPPSTTNNRWDPWPNRENLPSQNPVNKRNTNSTSHIPSLLKITVPHPNEIRVMPNVPNQADNANMMDAAKRKGLPAWIREGLEKMEREKQKQLEKVQQIMEINLYDEENTSTKNVFAKSINSLSRVPATVLDEESTDNEEVIAIKTNSQRDINLKEDNEQNDKRNSLEDKTYEQKLAELMIVVRRTLTELLLEATNEEISKVADETIKIFKSKASSAQVIRKSALSTLTDKLGLAAYADSSSENDSDNDESNSSKKATGLSESDNDSEEEIRNVVRLKRRAFIKTSEEIEERVALAAVREEEKLKHFLRKEEEEQEHNCEKQERSLVRDPSTSSHSGHNIFKGYEKDFGEITETKIQHLNGKRQKERSSRRERITRFSDNKEKYVALPNAATFLTNLNSATSFPSVNNTTAPTTNSQRQNIPDINGLLPNYTSTGMTNALNAADVALEKALKIKAPTNNEKQSRPREWDRSYTQSKKRQRLNESNHSRSRSKSSTSSTSSSSSSTSSDSESSSTSRSSHHSKYKRRSSKKHKSQTSVERQYEKSRKDNRSERKYSSSSYKKRDRESTSSRSHRNASSNSEDEYRRRYRNDSKYTRNSSQTHSSTSSRRARDREHSRSQSRSSYSSNNRRQ